MIDYSKPIRKTTITGKNVPVYKTPTQEKTATPKTVEQVILPDENYNLSKVTIEPVTSSIDDNIQPQNILLGVTILGVQGNLAPDKPDQNKTVSPTTSQQVVTADTGYELAQVTVEAVTSAIDSNIQPQNIVEGVSILGVTGTLEEGITPTGTLDITSNGEYDVTNYASVDVAVSSGGETVIPVPNTNYILVATDSGYDRTILKYDINGNIIDDTTFSPEGDTWENIRSIIVCGNYDNYNKTNVTNAVSINFMFANIDTISFIGAAVNALQTIQINTTLKKFGSYSMENLTSSVFSIIYSGTKEEFENINFQHNWQASLPSCILYSTDTISTYSFSEYSYPTFYNDANYDIILLYDESAATYKIESSNDPSLPVGTYAYKSNIDGTLLELIDNNGETIASGTLNKTSNTITLNGITLSSD